MLFHRFTKICAVALVGLLPASLPGSTQVPGAYRDLNHNGRMDPYEDPSLSSEARVDDLLSRMTLEEKVGTMLHGSLPTSDALGTGGNAYDLAAVRKMIVERHLTSMITRLSAAPAVFAEQANAVQRLAEATRLGIPVTISSDPRNHFQAVVGASTSGAGFSMWPETLGFAALGDPERVRRFADIARREYRAVGIQMALSPQADLASEPRWPRGTATFGSDPALVSRLVGAYVAGFQGGPSGLARDGVATVVKHWVGYGAEPDGFDAHNIYGRVVRLDERSFAQHVAAFDGAFAANVAGVMPTYAIVTGVSVNGRPLEPVGAGFSRQLLTDLLRGRKQFRGMVLSDWGITADCSETCRAPTATAPQSPAAIAMPWGVETLSAQERFAKGAMAGIDQFGGTDDPAPLLAAVKAGQVPLDRIDSAVRRVLLIKFELGLFDNPYVDPQAAARIVGSPQAQAEADLAQREAQVLLENRRMLPIAPAKTRVWLHGVGADTARALGFIVVDDPRAAEVAIVRMKAPFERLHPYHFFGARQNEGRLDFTDGDADFKALEQASAAVPTIAVVDLDRPAILTDVRSRVRALLVTFGASDAAVLDVITGRATPKGRLPYELPSSMAAVRAQDPAKPDDSVRPLYRRGAGL